MADFAERTGGSPPLITSDDCSTYAGPLLEQYRETVVPPRTGKQGRPRKPFKRWPAGSIYATVDKSYERGKVTSIRTSLGSVRK